MRTFIISLLPVAIKRYDETGRNDARNLATREFQKIARNGEVRGFVGTILVVRAMLQKDLDYEAATE
jgi:hypothetical protein